MAKFILLSNYPGGSSIYINSDHISLIQPCSVFHNGDWIRYSSILLTTGERVKVKETAHIILQQLSRRFVYL